MKKRLLTVMLVGVLALSFADAAFAFGKRRSGSSSSDNSSAESAAEETGRSAASGGAFTGDAQDKMGTMLEKAGKSVSGEE